MGVAAQKPTPFVAAASGPLKHCPRCATCYPSYANFCPADGQRLLELSGAFDDTTDPWIGRLLDERYRIEAWLGHGGMGVVYAARHAVLDKPVAIKLLRRELCGDAALVERFLREARAASRIGHPNIVDVTDSGVLPDGQLYLVLERLFGCTLDAELARTARTGVGLPIPRVLDLAQQIAHGLAAAHGKGIVHRDLKPANIFIVNPRELVASEASPGYRSDFVKLLDFGIAKFASSTTRLTLQGSVFGTPQYMSPEQARGAETDHRSDIYALGCILYEMLAGTPPFSAETLAGTLYQQVNTPPRALALVVKEGIVPPALEQGVLRMLAKRPDDRFAGMDEVEALLAACGRPYGLAQPETTLPPSTVAPLAPPPTPRGAPAERAIAPPKGAFGALVIAAPELSAIAEAMRGGAPGAGRSARRRDWVALALALLAAATAGAMAWLWWLEQRDHQPPRGAVSPSEGSAQPAPTRPPTPGATLVIETYPPRADVLSSGHLLGRTPLRLQVPLGAVRQLVFRREGYLEETRTFTASTSLGTWVVPLRPQPAAGRPARFVSTRRGGEARSPGSPPELRNPFAAARRAAARRADGGAAR